MISGGPVSLLAFSLAIFALGCVAHRFFARLTAVPFDQEEAFERASTEAQRLLDEGSGNVDSFIAAFGQDLVNHFGPESGVTELTIHDLREHVESAVLDLLLNCDCGHCWGSSGEDGAFWIEARYGDNGLSLRGLVAHETLMHEVACSPSHLMVAKAGGDVQNVTMTCETCKTARVVTSIHRLCLGKKPECAACVALGGASA